MQPVRQEHPAVVIRCKGTVGRNVVNYTIKGQWILRMPQRGRNMK